MCRTKEANCQKSIFLCACPRLHPMNASDWRQRRSLGLALCQASFICFRFTACGGASCLPERAEEVMCTADAVRIALEQDLVDEQDRNVILAHQFVTGAKRCDAEELQVGDLDQIPAELFEKFDYAALGHIHSHRRWKETRFAIAVRR